MINEGNTQKYTLRKSAKVVNALLAGALSLGVISLNAGADTLWQEDFEASAVTALWNFGKKNNTDQ